jgi:hypothetical protein
VEYQRRIVWLFFFFSFLVILNLYLNVKGMGLVEILGSFSSFLVITTLGNYDRLVLTFNDYYIQVLMPFFIYFFFFVFYIYWKTSYSKIVDDESNQLVKPGTFCIEVEGFHEHTHIQEKDLAQFFSVFGPVYEVSLNREYSGSLDYFTDLDKIDKKIKQEELEILLGSGSHDKLKKLKERREDKAARIKSLEIIPNVKSAFIHFMFEKSKSDTLQWFSDHYLFYWGTHVIYRNLCALCVKDP